MAEKERAYELIKLLYWPKGASIHERLLRWAKAFDAWLETRRCGYQRTVQFTSYQAWRDFLALIHKPPWEVNVADVNAYVCSLEERGQRPKTINDKLTALGNFYAYCQQVRTDAQCGPKFNPVTEARRPKIVHYEKLRSLDPNEENALLHVIQLVDSPINKRDYAMILTLLRTGWKSVRVRQLTWAEAEARTMNEEEKEHGLPPTVWQAIQDYLQAAGRLESIQPEDYVFAPVNFHLVSEIPDDPKYWDGKRPLTAKHLNRLVKQYAQLAGLKAEAITCHTLRHTAAMRLLQQGESLDAVGDYLGNKVKCRNRQYLRKLEKIPGAQLMLRKRGIIAKQRLPSRKPHRFQRRNHMRLTHGLKAKYLPEFKWLAEQGVHLDPFDAQILRWRIVIKRAAILWEYIETVEEACLLLKAMSKAATKLARALRQKQKFDATLKELGIEDLSELWGQDEWPPEDQ